MAPAPLVRIAAAYLTGVCLASTIKGCFLSAATFVVLIVAGIIITLFCFKGLFSPAYRTTHKRQAGIKPTSLLTASNQILQGTGMVVLFIILGLLRSGISYNRILKAYIPSGHTTITAVEPPTEKEKTWAVKGHTDTSNEYILLFIQKDSLHNPSGIQSGDIISVNPLHISYTYGTRSAADTANVLPADYYIHHHIFATEYATYDEWHTNSTSNRLIYRIRRLQSDITKRYKSSLKMDYDELALIEALSIGSTGRLKGTHGKRSSLKSRYATAGVSHVVALSGFHVGLLYILLNILFMGKLFTWRYRWIPTALIILSLWAFALIAGMQPSLTRAVLMLTIISVSSLISHKTMGIDSIFLAALIMTVYDPFMLFDVGFQLSYVAVAAISLSQPILYKIFIKIEKARINSVVKFFSSYVISCLLLSVVCHIATIGLSAHYYGFTAPLGIVSGLLVCTLSILLIYATVMWWMFNTVGFIGDFLGDTVETLSTWTNGSVDWFARTGYIFSWQPSALETLAYYMSLIAAILYFRSGKAAWLITALLLALLTILSMWIH